MNKLFRFKLVDGTEVTKSFSLVPVTFPIVSSNNSVVTGDPLDYTTAPKLIDVVDNIYKIECNNKASNDWYINSSGSNTTASAHIVSGSYITGSLCSVTFNLVDHGLTPLDVKSVTVAPKESNIGFNDSFILEDGVTSTTNGSGVLTLTLVPTTLDVTVKGTKKNTKFSILPSGSSCYASSVIVTSTNVSRNITPANQANYGYTAQASDARYALSGSVGGGGSINLAGLTPDTILGVSDTLELISLGTTPIQLELINNVTTDIQQQLDSKYTSGTSFTSSGVLSTQPVTVRNTQPDNVVDWVNNTASYGRFVFKEDGIEKGAFQMIGSGFDSLYSTSGRSNGMEFYNNSGRTSFFNNGLERMCISSSNVGIGVKVPSAKVHISGSTSSEGLLRVTTNLNSDVLYISSSGNVGIGTTNPTYKLEVAGGNIKAPIMFATSTMLCSQFIDPTNSRTGMVLSDPNSTIDLMASNASQNVSRLRIDGTTGNIGIGISSSLVNKLTVQGNISASSFTGSVFGTASYANTSSWATNATTANAISFVPISAISASYLSGAYTANVTTLSSSNLYVSGTGSLGKVGIGSTAFNSTAPEALLVSGSTYNVIGGYANLNSYAQLNMKNASNGTDSSSDVVATNDTGTESGNFIDMGINSSTYTSHGDVGAANDAYIYSTGSHLYIGNTTANKNLYLFAGSNTNTSSVVLTSTGKVGIGLTNPVNTLDVAGNISCSVITASLLGTASWATNVVNGGSATVSNYTSYATISTSSANWITASFDTGSNFVNITTGLLYNFTSSNLPAINQQAETTLYINNTATATSSLSFPATWRSLNGGWPTSITSSKCAVVWLRAYYTSSIVGTYSVEL